MVLYLVGAMAGLMLGVLRGGRLRTVAHLRVRWPLAAFAAGVGLALVRFGWFGDAGALLAVALGAAVAVAAANRHLAGMGVVAVGLAANLVPVVLDGGTPVDPRALRAIGTDAGELGPTQHLVTPRTTWPVLAGAIPVPPGFVASFGDLVIAVGLGAVAANATRIPRRAGIPVGEILADGPLTVDLAPPSPSGGSTPGAPPSPAATPSARRGDAAGVPAPRTPARRRERPVEVGPGTTVPVPTGWGSADDDLAPPVARRRPRATAGHPTMRLLHR